MPRKVSDTVWFSEDKTLAQLTTFAADRGASPTEASVTWDQCGEAYGLTFTRPETPEERTARLVRDRLVERQREYEAKKAKAAEAFKVARMEEFERKEYERLKAKFA